MDGRPKSEKFTDLNSMTCKAEFPNSQTTNRVSQVTKLKTVAILIGYQYHTNSPDEISQSRNNHKNPTVLPGILIDLYQAYTFAMKSSPTDIVVITDIEQDQIWKETVSAMGKHIVDSGILDFITTIRNKGIYNLHINKKWLENKLIKLFNNANRVLFYYTGHGKDGFLEMPLSRTEKSSCLESKESLDSDYMVTMVGETITKSIRVDKNSKDNLDSQGQEFKESTPTDLSGRDVLPSIRGGSTAIDLPEFIKMRRIRKICFRVANPNLEALFIFDSCNSTGLGMPFKLRPDGVFRLTDKIPRDAISYSRFVSKSIFNISETAISPQIPRLGRTDGVTMKWDSNETKSFNQLNPLGSPLKNTEPKTDILQIKKNTINQHASKFPLINPKIMTKERQFFEARAICISSTAPRQESLSTTDGSLFTRYLFEAISSGKKSLHGIKKNIEIGCSSYSQTASIYSTYPDLIFLWKWLYGGEKEYRVSVDIHHGLVVLSKIGHD